MRIRITSVFILLLIFSNSIAQAPHGIQYQAIIRNNFGDILNNSPVTVRFSIHEGTASGLNVYEETHSLTTNEFGLINATIGQGSVVSGNFSTINWLSDSYFLQMEMNDGSGFTNLGVTQFVSVPYALASNKSREATDMQIDDLTDVNSTGIANGQVLKWDGTNWVPGDDVGVGGGDNWGSQVVQIDSSLIGDGTSANLLGVTSINAYPGNVLKWNGTRWAPANDQVAGNGGVAYWINNGTDIYYDAGKVGIFNQNPIAALDIIHESNSLSPHIRLFEVDTLDYAKIQFSNPPNLNTSYWSIEAMCGNVYTEDTMLIFNSDGGHILALLGRGNVGVNTKTPVDKFHINADKDTLSNLRITNPLTGTTNNDGLRIGIGYTTDANVWNLENSSMIFGTNDFERMRITPIGNIGIGTSTPASKLHIVSNLAQPNIDIIKVDYSLNAAYDVKGIRSTAHPVDGYGYGGYFDGGYFGIYAISNNTSGNSGTINAGGFDANNVGNGTTYGVKSNVDGTGTGTKYAVYASANGSGTKYAGYFVGNVYATGTINSSDEKLKENISPLNGSLQTVLSLQPTRYNFRTNEFPQMNLPEGIHYGLIAQEVEKVLPQIVSDNIQPAEYDRETHEVIKEEVAFKGVNYTELIPLLIGAIQEQEKKIEELESKINALESQD